MPCSIPNCATCKISDYNVCEACLPSYTLFNNGESCQCLQGQGELMGGGCAECEVSHCLACNNGYSNSCDQCATNYAKVVTGNSTQCLCQLPFFVDEQGVCGCPPGKYQTGENQCSSCKVSNCASCTNNGTVCQ